MEREGIIAAELNKIADDHPGCVFCVALCMAIILFALTWGCACLDMLYNRSLTEADAVVTNVRKRSASSSYEVKLEYYLEQGELPEKQIKYGETFFYSYKDSEKDNLKAGQKIKIFIEPSGQIVMEDKKIDWFTLALVAVLVPFIVILSLAEYLSKRKK